VIEGTEQCEPPDSECGSGGTCDVECHCIPSTIGVEWTVPAPDTVASKESFPLRLEVSGTFTQVEGSIYSCPQNEPAAECFNHAIATTPATFSGPPGAFDFVADGISCYGEDDYYVVASVVVHHGSTTLGPFASPLTTTHILAPTTSFLTVSFPTLEFNAVEGQNPQAKTLTIGTLCGESVGWQLTENAPWLHVDPASGVTNSFLEDPAVSVDVADLDPGDSPFSATLTVSSPQAATPVHVPVTLNIISGVDAQWTVPAPESVASGASFPLSLEVSATGATRVGGHILSCPSDVPPDECAESFGTFFAITPEGGFSGPPGRFDFLARGIDCQGPRDYYLLARYFVEKGIFDIFGPFLSPLTTTEVLAPTAPILRVEPTEFHFNALGGQGAIEQTLTIGSVCGESVAWTAAGDTPWLSAVPPNGMADGSGTPTAVTVDVTGLDAGEAPFTGMLTVSSPQATDTIQVPVTVDILGGVTARWTAEPPDSVASREPFSMTLEVSGTFKDVSGFVFACRSDVPIDQCFFDETFAIQPEGFSGPPGKFDLVATGIDCQGPHDYKFFASLFIQKDEETPTLGPFLSPLTTTHLLAPTGPILLVSPTELAFETFPGENPTPEGVSISTFCGETISWAIATNAPWLHAEPASGTADSSGTPSAVSVDVSDLHTGELFNGMLTVSSPQASDSLSVPVTLRIFTGNAP
jgi:hypothetical protein